MAEIGVSGRVIYADIQFAVGCLDMGKQGGDIVHSADMTGKGLGTAARLHNAAGDCLAVINLATGDNDMGPLLSEKPGDFLANTATRAANKCYFSGKIK